MKQFINPKKLSGELNRFSNKKIGFVPTMGSLHAGHISLIKRCKLENDITIVSIYLNPTQFDNKQDYIKYPSKTKEDIAILNSLNVDYLFTPRYEDIYPDNFNYQVEEKSFSKELCGKTRDNHFTGVLTIVMKLLNITKPNTAYFGEKDFQQLKLVREMVKAFFMNTEIIACPIIRDEDGLALSSRNSRLTYEGRAKSRIFPKLLKSNLSNTEIKETLKKEKIKVDYIETKDNRRFGAIFIDDVRLIDNAEI